MGVIDPNINWYREWANRGPSRRTFSVVGETYEVEVRRVEADDD